MRSVLIYTISACNLVLKHDKTHIKVPYLNKFYFSHTQKSCTRQILRSSFDPLRPAFDNKRNTLHVPARDVLRACWKSPSQFVLGTWWWYVIGSGGWAHVLAVPQLSDLCTSEWKGCNLPRHCPHNHHHNNNHRHNKLSELAVLSQYKTNIHLTLIQIGPSPFRAL